MLGVFGFCFNSGPGSLSSGEGITAADQNNLYGKEKTEPETDDRRNPLTMVDFRTNYAKDIAALVQKTYGSQIAIFKNVIPMSVKAAETSAEGISIYTHCPKGKVSMAYMNLTQEVMNDEK